MPKYKEYVKKMIDLNKELFAEFQEVHDRYAMDDSIQEEFNQVGEKIMEVVRDFEARLCKTSENSGYGSYTTNLAEKFQGEVRKVFPMIDYVGVISSTTPAFALKKIDL